MRKLTSVFNGMLLASAGLALCPYAAAQSIKPGLWEMSSKMSSSSGEMEKGMAEMQKQLAAMPPEQRKMMEAMMAKQGVGVNLNANPGAMSVKLCITPEMAQRNELGKQPGDCQHTQTPRVGNTQKFSFTCKQPPSSGEGQITFISPEAYTQDMTVTTQAKGKTETIKSSGGGKFLSADCGDIKPVAMPKK
jgi:hypothetical protein